MILETGATTRPGIIRQTHLKDYLRILIARRWIVISAFALTVLGVTADVLVATPIYRAKATLLIEPAKLNLTEFKEVYDPTLGGIGGELARREFYQTQHKLMVSRPLLEKTFEEFKFGEMREFRDNQEPIESFQDFFAVNPIRRTRLVDVTFDWKDPELAARVLDFLIHAYILDYRQRSLGVSLGGIETLRKKAEELRPRVVSAADELQQFMVAKNMVSLEESQNIIVERLKEINKNLTFAENERIGYQSVIDNIKLGLVEKRPLEDMPEVADSKIIQDLKLEYIKSKQELNDISGRFGPNHPEVKAIEARLTAITQKMQREMRSILASAQAKLERADSQTKNLRRELSEQELRVMDLNKVAGKYNILKESHDTLKKTYNAIDKRIKEIEISLAAGSQADNIFIIQSPVVPVKHAKPKRLLSVALACVAGLILGVGLAFFVDYLDTTIKTKDETESVLQVPVIGFVPALDMNNSVKSNGRGPLKPIELEAIEKPRSALAESFRSIRTALEFSTANGEYKHLLVTSAAPKEGKTLVSLNVAISLAQAGKKTLLVDADMRKPRLHKLFRISSGFGLSNFLVTGEKSSIKVFPISSVPNLSVLSCGPTPPNPAELLGNKNMGDFIEMASAKYDMIVFDTPPIINVTDAVVLCKYVHSAIMVVRSFSTQRELAKRTGDLLLQAHGKLLGVILNNADVPRGGYYSYDSYYYYQQYYYYGDDGDSTRKRRKRGAGGRVT